MKTANMDCSTCKHYEVSKYVEPCHSCRDNDSHANYEPMEAIDQEAHRRTQALECLFEDNKDYSPPDSQDPYESYMSKGAFVRVVMLILERNEGCIVLSDREDNYENITREEAHKLMLDAVKRNEAALKAFERVAKKIKLAQE